MSKKNSGIFNNWRLNLVVSLFLVIGGIVIFRLFNLQILQHQIYLAQAQAQHENHQEIKPQRGKIFLSDKSGENYLLATNREFYEVFATPSELQKLPDRAEKIKQLAESLASFVSLPREEIEKKLSKDNDNYELLDKKITQEQYQKIKDLNLPAVYFSKSWQRWYPQGKLACQVLGFVGQDSSGSTVGRYGLEGYYEDALGGRAGFSADNNPLGDWTAGLPAEMGLAPLDGSDLYLSLDQNIQFLIEKELAQLVDKWQAKAGSIIVMNPKNGEILGMTNWPEFDPNKYFEVEDMGVFLNQATQDVYEPGSIFKPLTIAAGVDTNRVSPETSFFDTGSVTIGGKTITNAANRNYGQSDMTKVLEKSINTGAVFAEQKLGNDFFRQYIEKFGFSKLSGIDLAGERSGDLVNLNTNRDIAYANIAFGQGIAVTPMQILTALASIANGGKMMVPHVARKLVDANGRETVIGPKALGQPITSQTASKLTAMLVSTVKNGYDTVKVPGYFVAGKTGTAQVPNPKGGGYLEESINIHSFVGFAPAYNPAFIALIKLDQPKGIIFASSSLSPAFSDIANFILNYYEIPSDFAETKK